MTAVFNKHGLNFRFPENWEVQESFAKDAALEIYLLAPSGAFWSLLAYGAEHDGDQLMQNILESIKQQYEGFECEAINDSLAGIPLGGFNSNFFCLDLLVSNKMRTLLAGEHRLLIMAQAESREFEQQELVFDAITTSMLNGLKKPEE